jgi:D-tyrosyl-tRNA(Tyr) deacylase
VRALVQRVSQATVTVDDQVVGSIGPGLLIYAGVAADDGPEHVDYIANKIRHLRIFRDADDKMNLDVVQAGGAVLVVSNFTLLADVDHGRRPAFTRAAGPQDANDLYERLCDRLRQSGLMVQKGRFGAKMSVDAANDGPINIIVDSKPAP